MARAAAVVVALALAAAAGCGASSEPKGVQTPADWTKGVCGAVRSWASDLNARSKVLNRTIASAQSFAEARTRIGEYLDETIARTDTMLADVREQGRPDVAGGAEVAQQIETSLAKLPPALEDARAKADELPDDLEGFREGVKAMSDSVSAAESQVGDDLATIVTDSEHSELARAFAAEPTCNPQ
jgi:hypothetical protein